LANGGADLIKSDPVESWLREAAGDSTVCAATPRAPLRIGASLGHGRFVVGEVLGRGGMGTVYAVRDVERGASLALKTMLDTDPQRLLAFKNEFRSLRDLHHPNLVYLGELFEDEGEWFFTMERIHGVPFTRFVRPRALDADRLRASLVQLVAGLSTLHAAGKIHCDVKPSNTLIEPSGRVVLLDFGMVSDAQGVRRSQPGFGTLAYMAPEQASGEYAPAIDWYATGVMLYEALTGALPFEGPSGLILARKQTEVPPAPATRAAGVPSDLDRLCVELLDRRAAARPDGPEILLRLRGATRSSAPPRTPAADRAQRPFVGRSHEMGRLSEVLARACTTGPIIAMVRGDSGVGKTALVERFALEAGASARVLVGRCYEREFVPFNALDGVVDALAHQLDELDTAALGQLIPPRFSALARIFPVLERASRRAGSGAERTSHLRAPEARREAFGAFRELLSRLARRAPLLIIIDDLQWADTDSLAAIDDLLRGPVSAAILLVVLARSGTEPPLVPCELSMIDLEALRHDEATELARLLIDSRGKDGVPAGWWRDPGHLAEEAGCHPMFMDVLLHHAQATERRSDVTLDEALADRITMLDPRARDLIEVVSIAGQPLPPSAVGRVTALPPEPMARVVRGLQASRLVLTRRTGPEPSIVEPYHDRVRRAVVTCMPPTRQAHCHRRIAEALESLAPERSEALVVHWQAGGDGARARPHAIAAGHRARQALAFDRAASFYRVAIDLGLAAGSGAPSQLHRWHAEALASAGRGVQAAAAYRAAAVVAPAAARWELERCASEQLLRAGHLEEGLGAMDGLLAPLGMARPRGVAAAVRMLLGERLSGTCETLRRRLAPRRRLAGPGLDHRVDTCWAMAVGLSQVDPAAAAIFQLRHLRLARRLGDPVRIALGLCLCAPPAAAAGPAVKAHLMLAEARALMRGRNDPRGDGYQALAEGAVAFMGGDWDEALRRGEQAAALFRESSAGVGWEMANAQRFVLDCLWHTGELRALAGRARSTWQEASARGDRFAAIQLETTVLPVVHLKDDDPHSALDVLKTTLIGWPETVLSIQHWQQTQARVLIELYCGRFLEALHLMEHQIDKLTRTVLSRIRPVRLFTLFLHGTALVGAALDARGGARDAMIRKARRDVERIQREQVSECAALLRAQIAVLGGDRSAAIDDLASARRLFAERGMKLLSAVVACGWSKMVGRCAGEEVSLEAQRFMSAQEIRNPEGFVRMFAPALSLAPAERPGGP
jgi:hypothetical protein